MTDDIDRKIMDLRMNKQLSASTIATRLKLPTRSVYERFARLGLPAKIGFNLLSETPVKDALLSKMPYGEIAKKLGVSESYVQQCAKKWGIKRRVLPPLDDNKIIEMYVNQLCSVNKIVVELGYGRPRVEKRLRDLGLMRSSTETARARADRRFRENGIEYPIDRNGYPMSKVPEGHKTGRQMHNTFMFLHVLEMEKHLGRPIQKGETIHHIDFDKRNFQIDNLYLCKNQAEHAKIHNSLESVCGDFVKRGVTEFDGKRYVINEEKLQEYLASIEPSEIPDPIPRFEDSK